MDRLHALSNLTSLTKLHLSDLGGSTDEGLWPLLTYGRLTELHLLDLPDFFAASNPSWPDDIEEVSRSSKLLSLETSDNTGFLAPPICSLFSSTLTRLKIKFLTCKELELTKEQEEALQLLTSLQRLEFSGGSKMERLPAGLHKLINLKQLYISGCSAIKSLPSSLQMLDIYNCGAIESLPNSLPSSLEILIINACKSIKSLPKGSLPSSLQMLYIFCCGAIKSLPDSLPRSLEILKIEDCRAIKSLPKGGLPSSMRELDVYYNNSEELKRACRKLIGTIPIIRV